LTSPQGERWQYSTRDSNRSLPDKPIVTNKDLGVGGPGQVEAFEHSS
jgi:hypothetical protein